MGQSSAICSSISNDIYAEAMQQLDNSFSLCCIWSTGTSSLDTGAQGKQKAVSYFANLITYDFDFKTNFFDSFGKRKKSWVINEKA